MQLGLAVITRHCALKQVNTRRFIQSFDSIPSLAEISSCTSQDFVKDICKVVTNLMLSYFWVSPQQATPLGSAVLGLPQLGIGIKDLKGNLMLSLAQSIHSTKFTMDLIWILCLERFDSPRKTLMEAMSAWTLLKPLLLPPGRWLLPSPSRSRITRLSLLIQLIPQLSQQTDSLSGEHCNADGFTKCRRGLLLVEQKTTRSAIGRT